VKQANYCQCINCQERRPCFMFVAALRTPMASCRRAMLEQVIETVRKVENARRRERSAR
jgi:hypothetical protein